MSSSPIDRSFLEYVETGSPRALARVFDAVAGELLLLATHLTADAHTAEDLVQATFLAAIRGRDGYRRESGVKGWLVGILSNQARMEWRRLRLRLDPERLRVERSVSPDVEAELREFSAALQAAMEELPQRYREVVRLGLLHGLPVDQIALAVDRPRETVKTQLRRGIERLRQALPAGLALGALVALTPGRGLAAMRDTVLAECRLLQAGGSATAWSFVWSKAAGLVAVAVALVAAATLWWWPAAGGGTPLRDPVAGEATRALAGRGAAAPGVTRTPAVHDSDRAPAALEVRVRFARSGAPAAGVVVSVVPRDDPSWLREQRRRTDVEGLAVFDALPAGPLRVRGDRGGALETGGRGVVELAIPRGVTVHGRVADRAGAPVAGALLWLTPAGEGLDAGVEVGRTGDDGTFGLQDVAPGRALTTFAGSRQPPLPVAVEGAADGTQEVVLQCRGPGTSVYGVVRGPDGRPLAGAAVLVGWNIRPATAAVMPAYRLHTDAEGGFRAQGLPAGRPVPLWVRAPGTAVFHGRVAALASGQERFVAVDLEVGARVAGLVSGLDGGPAAGVAVEVREAGGATPSFPGPAWVHTSARTGADGRYDLPHLRSGEAQLTAHDAGFGAARATLRLAPADEHAWSPRLTESAEFVRGQVCDRAGKPLAGAPLVIRFAEPRLATARATADEGGRFSHRVRYPSAFALQVTLAGGEVHEHTGATGPDRLRVVVPAGGVSATLRGRVLGPDGAPVTAGHVLVARTDAERTRVVTAEFASEDGTFVLRDQGAGEYHVYPVTPGLGYGLHARVAVTADGAVDLGTFRGARPGRLRLRLLDPDGRPSVVANVNVARRDDPLSTPVSLTGGAGTSPLLQPGRWYLQVLCAGRVPLFHPVDVGAGADVEVVVPLRTGEPVELGYPPIGPGGITRWFTLRDGDGATVYRGFLVVGATKRTESFCLPSGPYRCDVALPAGRAATTTFTVTAGQVNRFPLQFPREE